MSEHKTGQSNWAAEDKKLYRERRNKGLRGQTQALSSYTKLSKNEKDEELKVPLGDKVSSLLSRGKHSDTRAYKREQRQMVVRQQRKGSTRGE